MLGECSCPGPRTRGGSQLEEERRRESPHAPTMWCAPCQVGDLEQKLSMSLGEASTIGELIDGLPLGRWHLLHVVRQVIVNACFAIVVEMTPYVFQGFEADFQGIQRSDLALYAALFTGGGRSSAPGSPRCRTSTAARR